MGTWATRPFDNDNAADFADAVAGCTDTEARTDLLLATLLTVSKGQYDPSLILEGYSYPHEVDNAIAAAAFVADIRNDRHQFTDCSYAMKLDNPDDFMNPQAWSHIQFDFPPRPDLVEAAGQAMERVLRDLVHVGITDEWQEPIREILAALKE